MPSQRALTRTGEYPPWPHLAKSPALDEVLPLLAAEASVFRVGSCVVPCRDRARSRCRVIKSAARARHQSPQSVERILIAEGVTHIAQRSSPGIARSDG